LGVSEVISQISGVPGLDGFANRFLSWWNKENRVLIFPILRYRSRECEDTPPEDDYPQLASNDATTYDCSIDYFLSPPLVNARALWIACQRHCTASTNMHGFSMRYSFPISYLPQWLDLDAQLWAFIDNFVVSHNNVIHQ
jgi:hypothetical protein